MSVFKMAPAWVLFLPVLYSSAFNLGEQVHVDTNTTTDNNNTVFCTRERVYDRLDVRLVLGKWKAVLVYTHLIQEGVNKYPKCPEITLWETGDFPETTWGPSTENQLFHVQHINARFRQQYRHLRLLWDEAGETLEYSLYFRNDSAGYWQAIEGQNGTLAQRTNYRQFSGVVQVLKAVNDHLLLNFCQEASESRPAQLYSVLFSREPAFMPRWEVDSVHNILQNKRLSIASRRMVCGNGAGKPLYSLLLSILLSSLILKVSST